MNAKTLVDDAAKANPNLVRLAEAVSFAVVVDRPLLRAARLSIPDTDVSLEADLWLSELAHTRSPQGLTFQPEVAAVLRERLAKDPARMNEAWTLTQRLHAHLDDTLKIEEKIRYLSISKSEGAAGEIDRLLKSVLAAMVDGGRDALAHWTARALESFPTSVRNLPTAQMLDAGARLRMGADVSSDEEEMPEWMSLVAPSHLPRTAIGVRLLSDGIELDASSDPRGDLLQLPQTRPLLLEVSWTAKGTMVAQQVTLQPGEQLKVKTRATEIELRTITGERYKLRRSGSAPSSVARHILSFDDVLERHSRLIGREEVIRRIRSIVDSTPEQAQTIVITGPAGRGKTALLAELVRQLSKDTICLPHFFQPGIPRYSYFDSASRSIIAQLIARFDLPPWTISMPLRDVLSDLDTSTAKPIVIVLDDIDRMEGGYTPENVLEQLSRVSGPITVIASSTTAARVSGPRQHTIELTPPTADEAVRYIEASVKAPPPSNAEYGELEVFARRLAKNIPPERDVAGSLIGGIPYRALLQALALARGPLPFEDMRRLARSLRLEWDEDHPFLERRTNDGVDSMAFINDWARDAVLRAVNRPNDTAMHRELANAIAPEKYEGELSWYGLLYGPFHWTRAGRPWHDTALDFRLMWRRIETFGAAVALDAIEEAARHEEHAKRRHSAPRIIEALRAEQSRLEQWPADAPAILSSALQRVTPDVSFDTTLVPLRMQQVVRVLSTSGVVMRLPASVTALHWSEHEDRVLVQLDSPDLATIALHPRDVDEQAPVVLSGHPANVTVSSAIYSGISGARDGTVCFWDLLIGRRMERSAAHADIVTASVMGENTAVSCSADGTFVTWFWDLREKPERWRIDGGGRASAGITVAAADFRPMPFRVAAGCQDGSVGIVDDEWTLLDRFHDGPVKAIAVHGARIATAGHDQTLRLYDLSRSELGEAIPGGHDLGVAGMQFSPDGRLLVTWSADRTARIWSVHTLWPGKDPVEPVAIIRHHDVITTATFAGTDKSLLLLTASADGEIRASDADTGKPRWHDLRHRRAVRSLAVVEETVHSGGDDRMILASNVQTGEDKTPLGSAVTKCGVLMPSGTIIAAAAGMMMWRSSTSPEWHSMEAPGRLLSVTSQRVVGAVEDQRSGRIKVRSLHHGLQAFVDIVERPGRVLALAASPAQTTAVTLDDGRVWLLSPKERIAEHRLESAATAVAATDVMAFAGTQTGALFEVRPGGQKKLGEHASRVTAIAIHASGMSAVSGALDGSVLVTNLEAGQTTRVDGHAGAVVQCAYADYFLLTASDDGTLAIRTLTGNRIAVCEGHRDRITSFAFRDRRDAIYTASLDGTIRAWTFEGKPRGVFYGTVGFTAIAATPFGAVAGDDAGNIWLIQDGHIAYVPPTTPPRAKKKTPVRRRVMSSSKRSSSKKRRIK